MPMPSIRTLAAGAVLLAAVLLAGWVHALRADVQVLTVQRDAARRDLEGLRREHTMLVAQAKANADAADRRYRALETNMATKLKESADVRARERRDHESRAAAWTAERAGLRGAIAAAASPGGGPGGDSLAACRERAATLGDLLAEGVQLQAELAAAAEDHAADVRSLQRYARALSCGGP